MGLQTILWRYDSNDWRVGQNNITAADVDTSYNNFINNLTAGTFNTVGGLMLTHEVNNFTMQEAINFYPRLKAAFSVRSHILINHVFRHTNPNIFSPLFLVHCPHWYRPQQDPTIRRDDLFLTHVRGVYVFMSQGQVL
jgi:hypothetical protein